jgi:signal recognition particle receptor subunit beta
MVYIDIQHREVTLKLVYYGPALSGKTTNLQQLHALMMGHTGGELVSLDTRDDRTLFFDLLPIEFETRGGFKIRLKLFTVPGQVIHNATRKIVLQGADGVAFIADSRVSETRSNNESFANLKQNLRDNGLDFDDIALVIQFNKRDLPGIRSDAEIKRIATKGKEPVYTAVGVQGLGVPETFLGLAALSWRKLEAKFNFAERFGVTHDDFMARIGELFGGKDPNGL